MNTLLTIFLVIGGFGFLFLLASLIIGDIFEMLDFEFDSDFAGNGGSDIGILDSRVVSVFLTAFGGVAAVTLYLGFGGIISALVGLLSGVVFGGMIFGFGYFLHTQQATSSVGDRDLIGRTAKVIVGIQPDGIGQISCLIGEERIEKIARSRDGKGLKEGETVFIEEISGDSFVVSKMDRPALFETDLGKT